MPICLCYTNLKDSEIPEEFEQKLSACVSETLNKPEARIQVILQTGLRKIRSGSKEPSFLLQIRSINVFDEERNPGYFQKIFPFLKEILPDVPENRVTVEFIDIPNHMVQTGPK